MGKKWYKNFRILAKIDLLSKLSIFPKIQQKIKKTLLLFIQVYKRNLKKSNKIRSFKFLKK